MKLLAFGLLVLLAVWLENDPAIQTHNPCDNRYCFGDGLKLQHTFDADEVYFND